jgi:putative ABC transport system permease protein
MVKNFVVLFLRNLQRQKLFSLINLLGLTVSIASTLLIFLYVKNEYSYDSFHANSERLYRVNQTFIWAENSESQFSRTGPGVAHALKEELPEVEMVTSLHTPGNLVLSYVTPSNKVITFEEDQVFAADTNFFRIFNFPLIQGSAAGAFSKANTVVLTESTAAKYFGSDNPIGKVLSVTGFGEDRRETYEVIGVTKDVPGNSTIQFDVLVSNKAFNVERMHWSWVWTQLETFVLLQENADIETVRRRLAQIPEKRLDVTLKNTMNTSYKEYVASGKKWELFLQPIKSLHLPLYPVVGSFPDTGNIKTIYSMIGAAIFIALLSCINFMNLSTAQFTRRVKEAGLRKILGLGKRELVIGNLLEALAFCMLALIAGLAITQILLPAFSLVTGKSLSLNVFDTTTLLSILAIVFLMAIISSIYPSLFLSKFQPVEAVKGKLRLGKDGKLFRNGLVVFQFSVSIVLLVCTGIVFQQLRYVSQKDLGFEKENLLELKHVEILKDPETLVKEISNNPSVVSVSLCSSTPPSIFGGDSFSAEGRNGETFNLNYTSADETYLPTLGIKLKFGRNFSENNPSDTAAVIVNESLLRKLGWEVNESVLGKKITYPNEGNATFNIVGVASDFNYWSLAITIDPMAIFHVRNQTVFHGPKRYLAVRIKPSSADQWDDVISSLEKSWKTKAGDAPFEYGFVDDYFDDTFKSQQQFGKVLVIMALLAVMIACLGLLGMIIYSLEQRTKEIGIRKVSGASSWNILLLISQSYTKLILLSFVFGFPLSMWIMKEWLKDFAYRVTPSPWVFVIAGVSMVIISALITSYHSLKAAHRNPVDVLKDE